MNRIAALLIVLCSCGEVESLRHLPDGGDGDAPVSRTVTIAKAGSGKGVVSGDGIDCGPTCTITLDDGASLSLTATPAEGATFAGWGGECSGATTCDVTVTGDITITANFALNSSTLFITKTGAGTGSVTSAPGGIDCGTTCEHSFTANETVTLTATTDADSTFAGWSGGCTGTGTTCTVTMNAARSVNAAFTHVGRTLDVTRSGSGVVTSIPVGIDCGSDCAETFEHGTSVMLDAVAATGSTFAGWSGACTGTGACTVAMTAMKSVTATFTTNNYALTVTKTGNGAVTGTGISCGSDCTESYAYGTSVTLAATPATGSTFAGWSGACTGTGSCIVTIDAAKSVTATFTTNSYTLTVAKTGNGTISGTGISCGTDCSESYPYGTSVTLTATPATGSTFTGWSGACTGTGSCIVTIDAAKSVTATFTTNMYTLNVSTSGNGIVAGTGITCGTDCSETFAAGTTITFTAMPATGQFFVGWGGACSGTGSCTVTMDSAKTVTASFAPYTYVLNVSSGAHGTVTGTGISCGTDCVESYAYGTTVTLTATWATGYYFAGWDGACSGTGACTITMNSDKAVTASFIPATYMLTVTNSGGGTVSGTGIDCGNDCSEPLSFGTTVTLDATPANGYYFVGWGGACSGTGACIVTIDGAKNVTATFSPSNWNLNVTANGAGYIFGPGISCGVDCDEPFAPGTVVTLTAQAENGWRFVGWTTPCENNGTGPCTVTVSSNTYIGANFVPLQ